MPDLLTNITDKYPSLTKVEQHIASYVLENGNAVTRMSIFELAKACDVGSTSVFRFCNDLGTDGYSDFRLQLSQALALRGGTGKSADDASLTPPESQQHIHTFSSQARSILHETSLQLDAGALEKAAKIIAESRKICFVGFQESMLPALDAKLRFMKLTDGTEFSTDEHMQLMSIALMRSQDAVVLFSAPEDEKEAVSIAHLAEQNQVRIIAITSYHSAQLQRRCDVFLPAIHQSQNHGSLIASRYSQALIMDLLVDQCKQFWQK